MDFITYAEYLKYSKNNSILQLRETETEYKHEKKYDEKIVQKIDKIHDKIFKKVFSITKEMTIFLNEFLDEKEKINSKQIIQCKTDFITKDYKNRQADIIYKLKEKPVYFLVEHQSTFDKDMILRLWEYVGQIMKQETLLQKYYFDEEFIYPIVVPIVIYTGYKKWNLETNLEDKQYIEKQFNDYKINFKYNLITINDYVMNREQLIEELLNKKSLFGSIMIIEKCKTKKEIKKYMDEIIQTMKNREDKNILAEIIGVIIEPLLGIKKTEEMLDKLYRKETNGMSPFTKTLLDLKMKYETEGLEKGMKKGMKKGIKEGIKEGKKEGIFQTAKKMLEKNMNLNEIKEITGLSNEEIQKLVKS